MLSIWKELRYLEPIPNNTKIQIQRNYVTNKQEKTTTTTTTTVSYVLLWKENKPNFIRCASFCVRDAECRSICIYIQNYFVLFSLRYNRKIIGFCLIWSDIRKIQIPYRMKTLASIPLTFTPI